MGDEENVVEKIKEYASGKSILVVFDDMINSKSLSTLATLFTVDGRHMNMSLIFLAQQITPGSLHLINIYIEATKDPFSYVFINLTQECDPNVKYLSQLFNKDHTVKA